MSDTPREKWERNHAENLRIMRGRAEQLRKAGETEDAARIWELVAIWEQIGKRVDMGSYTDD